MTNGQESRLTGPISEITAKTLHGQYDRRAVIRRAMALGLAAPLVAAMLEAVPVAAQEASPAAAPAGDPIKIGSPYNLTGGYASIDNPAANGSRLAVKELNEAGGVLGRPLEIIIEDGRSDVPTITSVAK
jgi:ABC-type branched-subunit amino acid transport system substrate-binding protein